VRRLIQILSKVMATFSLLLCLAALGLWLRSYFAYQYLIRKEPQNAQWIEVSRGELSARLLTGVDLGGLPVGSAAEWGWGSHSPTDLFQIYGHCPKAKPALCWVSTFGVVRTAMEVPRG
jgi:hypothetical protein